MKKLKIPFLVLIGLVVIIQFIARPEKLAQPVTSTDIVSTNNLHPDVSHLLQTACYDCHSGQPTYPWYFYVAPVNWIMDHHIEEGREHLNFSDWGKYSQAQQDHKLEEIWEEVEEGEMPLSEYTFFHPEANLSAEQLELLKSFVETERAKLK